MRARVNIGDCKSPSSAPADLQSAGTGLFISNVLVMVKKVLWFLILLCHLFMPKNVLSQDKIEYRISLEMDDTIRYGELVQVKAVLETEKLLPIMVKMHRYIAPTKLAHYYVDHCIYLEVVHNGTKYEEGNPSLLLHTTIEPKKTWLSKWFPCDDIHGVFYFCNLLPENIVLTHSKEELFNVKNKDFGEYQIRAIFVNMDNDTIVSNPITIKYIEH